MIAGLIILGIVAIAAEVAIGIAAIKAILKIAEYIFKL